MAFFLTNKRVLLGVTGSIAAYKSADLTRRLREAGGVVRVVMTDNAKQFITPLTMQAVSGHPVHDALFDLQAEAAMSHIELARWADVVLIAPATANFMARLAQGKADDLLTTLCLATRAPIAIAPAMNQGMWQHTLTQSNLQLLKKKPIYVMGPSEGSQACGDNGPGCMLAPEAIVTELNQLFATGTLAGLRVLVTAGPTHEAIDPVRYLTNGSSGKMGFALAEAAREAGAVVTLVSGPVSLLGPAQMNYVPVVSAQAMYEAVMSRVAECDLFLSVAAVSDYRCETIAGQKIHKGEATLQLKLIQTPDIIAAVGQLDAKQRPFIVGFAAETENVLAQAALKRQRKKMDMIIANRVDVGMGGDENAVSVLSEQGQVDLPLSSKTQLARQLVEMVAKAYQAAREASMVS